MIKPKLVTQKNDKVNTIYQSANKYSNSKITVTTGNKNTVTRKGYLTEKTDFGSRLGKTPMTYKLKLVLGGFL